MLKKLFLLFILTLLIACQKEHVNSLAYRTFTNSNVFDINQLYFLNDNTFILTGEGIFHEFERYEFTYLSNYNKDVLVFESSFVLEDITLLRKMKDKVELRLFNSTISFYLKE